VPTFRTILATTGHLGVWASLYGAAASVLVALLADAAPSAEAAAFAWLVCIGAYLVDRVKWSDALLDPADELAHPARAATLRSRTRILRGVAITAFALACAIGASRAWAMAIVPPAAATLVWIYAARRPSGRAPRPKDLPIVKNAFVAVALAGLGVVAGEAWTEAPLPRLFSASVVVALVVFGDAVLCDLDDAEADARFGTATLATRFGARAAVITALGAHATASLAAGLIAPEARAANAALVVLTATTALALKSSRPVRDLVDLRLAVLVAAATIAGG
jgi:4-hydroxybenzoate polyprenyltransferase